MSYAEVTDVQGRMTRTLSSDEMAVCANLLADVAVMIDAVAQNASADAKKIVSCRAVIRAIGDGDMGAGFPVGVSQGSQGALGYTQSWTVSSGGSIGELYLSKADRRMLGLGDRIGSYSPVQELVPEVDT